MELTVYILLLFSLTNAQPRIPQASKVSQCPSGKSAIMLKHEKLSPQTQPTEILTASIKECSSFCQNNQLPGGGDIACVGFKFETSSNSCDLYTDFSFLLPGEVDFYQKTCVPGQVPNVQDRRPPGLNPTVDRVSDCGSEEFPVMIMHEQSGPSSGFDSSFSDSSLDECSTLCGQNKDPVTGEGISCAGFDYDSSTRTCRTYSFFNTGKFQFGTLDFYQKACVQTNKICSSPFTFEMKPQQILVGFAREVVTTPSVAECLKGINHSWLVRFETFGLQSLFQCNCMESIDNYGFECESLMYYPADQECILNTEDRRDRPDLFVAEDQDEVIYFDNNCAGSQCFAPYVTQYIRVEGQALVGQDDLVVRDVSLEGCEQICTSRISDSAEDFSCKSFTYRSGTRECSLADERAKPVGRAEFVVDQSGNYYEKKCFSSARVCRNVPSFDRVPQMILVGFAAFVLESVPSVTQCLDNCVSPPAETGSDFECKSVMYYYNEQECILNTETRTSKPELFIPEGEGFQVDYFDISCSRKKERCPDGTVPTSIRTKDVALPLGEDDIFRISDTVGDAQTCQKQCYAVYPEKCRAFNFDPKAQTCDLLYIKNTAPVTSKTGVDNYQLACLGGSKLSTPFKLTDVDGETADVFGCQNNAAAFDRFPGQKLEAKVQQTLGPIVSVSDCLSACLYAPYKCDGVNYYVNSGRCDLVGEGKPDEEVVSKRRRKRRPLLRRDPNVDCYLSNCRGFPVVSRPEPGLPVDPPPPLPLPPTSNKVSTVCNFDGIKVMVHRERPFSGAVFVKNKYDSCRVEMFNQRSTVLQLGFPLDAPSLVPLAASETVHQEARRKRQTDLQSLSGGASFVEGGTVPGAAANQVGLAVVPVGVVDGPSVAPVRDCGVVDLGNFRYGATVVVQSNNLGIPGLVTSLDDIYQVSCDYSEMLGRRVQAESAVKVEGPVASIIQPQGKIELASPVMLHMMNEAGDAHVLKASIGDMLELRWQMMAIDDDMDFFIRECVAERGEHPTSFAASTEINTPGTLKLLEKGCPTPAVSRKLMTEPVKRMDDRTKSVKLQAFRFDGSQSIRIVCKLDICQGGCHPAACNLPGHPHTTFGRKKRDTDQENMVDLDEQKTNHYKISKHSKTAVTLMIVDPLQDLTSTPSYRSQHKPVQVVTEHQEFVHQEVIENSRNKVCLSRSTFLGVFLFLGLLATSQAVVITAYSVRRLIRKQA